MANPYSLFATSLFASIEELAMALDTYSNLQTAIAGFLNRTDLTAAIPDFIALAEAQMLRRLADAWQNGRALPRKMVARTSLTIDAEYVALPADFLGPLALLIDAQGVQLGFLAPDGLARQKARRGAAPSSGVPLAYSVVGSQFQFLPAPDRTYSGALTYWQKFTALSGGNPSNWVLADHPDAYLYGAALQSAPYLMDDERSAMWANFFATALDDLIKSDPLPNDGTRLRTEIPLPSWGRGLG